jgi:hypothetical protein
MSADALPVLAFVYDRQFTPRLGPGTLRLEHCEEYAAETGMQVAGTWVDTGDHALSDTHRPRFDAMVSILRSSRIEGRSVVCLVADWGRLSHDAGRQAAFRYRIATAGGYTVTAQGEDDRLPVDRRILRTARPA